MKYKVGEELNVRIKVLQVDDTDMPYYVGFEFGGDESGVWLDSETLEKAVHKANPDQYRRSILEQIQVLQKELDEIDGEVPENQLVVGKTYRIVDNNSFHHFRTGELVKVECFDVDEGMYKAYDLGRSDWWFIDINDVEEVK